MVRKSQPYIVRAPSTSRSKCLWSPKRSRQQSSHGSVAPDDCDTLPCYESLENLVSVAAPTPPEPTDYSKGGDRASAQQGRSGTLSEYFDHYDQGFELKMAPIHPTLNLDILGSATRHWAAILLVKTKDVPRLMREGFFWSTENIVPEEGYMTSPTMRLLDGLSLKLLPGFRLQNLSRGNVFAARAWTALHRIYKWDCRWIDECNYNCIYGDKPLRGWWPWPREVASSASVLQNHKTAGLLIRFVRFMTFVGVVGTRRRVLNELNRPVQFHPRGGNAHISALLGRSPSPGQIIVGHELNH